MVVQVMNIKDDQRGNNYKRTVYKNMHEYTGIYKNMPCTNEYSYSTRICRNTQEHTRILVQELGRIASSDAA